MVKRNEIEALTNNSKILSESNNKQHNKDKEYCIVCTYVYIGQIYMTEQ